MVYDNDSADSREAYDDDMKDLIARRYKEEIEMLFFYHGGTEEKEFDPTGE